MKTPIEMMIDRACGLDGNAPVVKKRPKQIITLRCPKCRREKEAYRDRSDHPDAAIGEFPCPRCRDDSAKVAYFDQEELPLQ